jgi:hypothetical protein
MELQQSDFEPETNANVIELDSWNPPRTREQLLGFIANRESIIFDSTEDIDELFAA